jgi:hypothetical protein
MHLAAELPWRDEREDVARMAARFTLIETKSNQLWDFGWFDLTRFEVEGSRAEADVRQVLRQFLSDPVSQRSFCDQSPWGEATGRHGPFVHGPPLADHLRPVGPQEFAEQVARALSTLDGSGPPDAAQRGPVEVWERAVSNDALYMLDVPSTSELRVDWAWVWFVYHEFLSVAADGRELTVAVIGYD